MSSVYVPLKVQIEPDCNLYPNDIVEDYIDVAIIRNFPSQEVDVSIYLTSGHEGCLITEYFITKIIDSSKDLIIKSDIVELSKLGILKIQKTNIVSSIITNIEIFW